MPLIKLLTFLSFIVASIFYAPVSLGQCAPEKHISIPNVINLTYHDARNLLIDAGWQPEQTSLRTGIDSYGNSEIFIDKGYL